MVLFTFAELAISETGRIRVAAPLRLNDEAVRLAVISRLGWIHRQRANFNQQERQSQTEFATVKAITSRDAGSV